MYKILILLLLLLLPSLNSFATPILKKSKIGVILPLTGELSRVGKKLREAIELSVKDNGDNVQVIFEDGSLSISKVISAYRRLHNIHGISYFIGPFGPDQVLALAPIAKKDNSLLVSISLCDDRFKAYSNVYCTFPHSSVQLAPMLDLISKDKIDSVALIAEELLAIEPIRKMIIDRAKLKGISIAQNESFTSGFKDFRPLLVKLRKSKNMLLIIAGASPSDVALAYKQAFEINLKPRMIWYISEHDGETIKINKNYLEGAYSLAIPKISSWYKKKFKKVYGNLPDDYNALGYDATTSLLLALKTKKKNTNRLLTLNREIIKNPAVLGFKFNSDRQVDLPVSLTKITNGKVSYVSGS